MLVLGAFFHYAKRGEEENEDENENEGDAGRSVGRDERGFQETYVKKPMNS
jgi:hypothetical protein